MLKKLTAMLAALTATVHIFVGGADALAPTLAADLAPAAAGAMHACWHLISALLLWSIVVFWRGGEPAIHFGLLWVVFAVVFIYVGLAQAGLQGLVTNPQWTILGLTGGLALFGAIYETSLPFGGSVEPGNATKSPPTIAGNPEEKTC